MSTTDRAALARAIHGHVTACATILQLVEAHEIGEPEARAAIELTSSLLQLLTVVTGNQAGSLGAMLTTARDLAADLDHITRADVSRPATKSAAALEVDSWAASPAGEPAGLPEPNFYDADQPGG